MSVDLIRNASPKPPRGEYSLERRGKKRERKLAEDRIMAAARRRDGNKCRFPRCSYKGLIVEVAHFDHRGMGGNPSGDKTQRDLLICLCVRHHDQFDGRALPQISIDPVPVVGGVRRGTDGPCVFYVRDETGAWQHVATERLIGISETRGA